MSSEITLRVLEKEDLSFMHRLNNDDAIMSYWFEEPYRSMARLEDAYEKNKNSDQARLFILAKGEVNLGFVALFSIDPIHRKAEYAIMMDPEHQGHGYASIATQLAMEYAFAKLNLNKLYLVVDSVNEKAIHVYEKSGFHVEGTLKEEYFINGSYHDVVIMSMFQREYLQLNRE